MKIIITQAVFNPKLKDFQDIWELLFAKIVFDIFKGFFRTAFYKM